MTFDESKDPDAPWRAVEWAEWTKLLLDSYEQFVGHSIVPRNGLLEDSQKLFEAPFVVVAHGTQVDPLLNYGNRTALNLWQLPVTALIGMPSRKTAEPMHRDEREQLLKRTREHGFIDDYSGIRIAATGQRFRIHQATVWNVVNVKGCYLGQAAAFADWTFLDDEQSSLQPEL